MNDTFLSLLHRLRQTSDSEAWNRLMDMYAPLLKRWLGRYGVQESDVDDLMQGVLLAVTKDVGEFDHNGRTGAFRSWLKMILIHRLRNFWRMRGRRPQAAGNSDVQQQIDQLEDPTSEMSAMWNRQHDEFVVSWTAPCPAPFPPQGVCLY